MPFNPSEALLFANLSNEAYSFSNIRDRIKRYRLELRNPFLYDKTTDTQGFIASDSQRIVISMRGTEFQKAADRLTDLNIKLIPYLGIKDQAKVHMGFHSAVDAILGKAQIMLDEISNKNPTMPIILTGHSLGGALVTLMAPLLKARGYSNVRVYTYGSPMVGDSFFTTRYGSSMIETSRIVHHLDVVPWMPQLFPYTHVDTLVVCDENGNMGTEAQLYGHGILGRLREAGATVERLAGNFGSLFIEGIRDHSIVKYIAAISKAANSEQVPAEAFLSDPAWYVET